MSAWYPVTAGGGSWRADALDVELGSLHTVYAGTCLRHLGVRYLRRVLCQRRGC